MTAAALARFCRTSALHESIFLLCGYAGTGKTTLVSALVRALHQAGVATVLLAPTGRAAKFLAAYADYPASTIHRKIYYPPGQGRPFAAVMDNPHQHTVFIVDEASMIGARDAGSDVLTDLIHYVYSGHYCRIVFVGDTAQLPPVGCKDSPALNPAELRSYGLRVSRVQLTHTVRQAGSSGILFNATAQRKQMLLDPLERPYFNFNFDDVFALPGEELQETITELYDSDGIEETVLITRANWRATKFNLAIRSQILERTEELSRDEQLLVAKNNYHWASKIRELDFIANGDTARVVRIYGTEERYGFRFADVRLEFPYRSVELDCKIILECLTSDAPALTSDQQQALFDAVYNDSVLFTDSTPRYVRL
ncbi:MAG: AAA family ATPase, partial [Muribaculaceae bacterium]|nr:AAA family ATPase [Muribaculaceae bacterium]